ncbi:MAG: sugar phosphate isomerase/epimerase family protein [Anaerolineae bacterium]
MFNPIACMTAGYPGHGLERVLEGIAKAGFQYIELIADPQRTSVDNLSESRLNSLRRQIANAGLFPISVAGHTNLVAPDGVAAFKRRMELAAAVGARIVNTGSGHTETKEEEERFFSIMPGLIKYAERSGIVIAFETHGGLTGTGKDARRTLERLGSPMCKVNYDTANVIYYRGKRPEQDIADIADQVVHVHLKDKIGGEMEYNFPPLGEGTIDFRPVVSALQASGYLGPYSVEIEVEGERTPEEEDALRRQLYSFTAELLA